MKEAKIALSAMSASHIFYKHNVLLSAVTPVCQRIEWYIRLNYFIKN